MKTCKNCLEPKHLSEFRLKNKSKPGVYRGKCIICENTIARHRNHPGIDRVRPIGPKNLTGMNFGQLTVLELVERRRSRWKCICKCGAHTTVQSAALFSGKTKSCGHLRQEVGRNKKGMKRKKTSDRELDRFLFTNEEEYQFYLEMENGR